MKKVLEIVKLEMEFYLLQRADNFLEALVIIPLINLDLAENIIFLANKEWQEKLQDYKYCVKNSTNEDIQIPEDLETFRLSKTDSLQIKALPNYFMGSSQVRVLQHILGLAQINLLSDSEYVSINKILIPYEKALSRLAPSLDFYYSLQPLDKSC